MKIGFLSLMSFTPSFILGYLTFLGAYASRHIGPPDMIAPINNLAWGIPFLATIRLFTPEPYLRIAFYSFISPTIVFALYKTYAMLSAG